MAASKPMVLLLATGAALLLASKTRRRKRTDREPLCLFDEKYKGYCIDTYFSGIFGDPKVGFIILELGPDGGLQEVHRSPAEYSKDDDSAYEAAKRWIDKVRP